MKIEIASLRLVGCGPFDDVTLNFCDNDGKPKKTILLAGANGSGKTTALENIVEVFKRFFNFNDISNFWPIKGHARLEINIDHSSVFLYGGNRPSDINDSDTVSNETINKLLGMRAASVDISRDSQAPCVIYFPYRRSINPIQSDSIHQEKIKYHPIFSYSNTDKFQGSLSSYLIWLEYAETEEYNRTIKILNNLNLGKTFSVDRKQMQAVACVDGITHTLDRLSSGEQNILIILLELIRRLTHGSIVIIDEIENHLHPAYQYKLIYALKKLQEEFYFQLIMTTHSIDILNAVGPGNTLFLTDYSDLKVELLK